GSGRRQGYQDQQSDSRREGSVRSIHIRSPTNAGLKACTTSTSHEEANVARTFRSAFLQIQTDNARLGHFLHGEANSLASDAALLGTAERHDIKTVVG